jgi:hypothetical protein
MSHAKQVLEAMRGADIVACTLEGGYAVTRTGGRILFQPCRVESCKRNAKGRCTSLIARYYDGSRLRFTWSEDRGPRYAVLADAPHGADPRDFTYSEGR